MLFNSSGQGFVFCPRVVSKSPSRRGVEHHRFMLNNSEANVIFERSTTVLRLSKGKRRFDWRIDGEPRIRFRFPNVKIVSEPRIHRSSVQTFQRKQIKKPVVINVQQLYGTRPNESDIGRA